MKNPSRPTMMGARKIEAKRHIFRGRRKILFLINFVTHHSNAIHSPAWCDDTPSCDYIFRGRGLEVTERSDNNFWSVSFFFHNEKGDHNKILFIINFVTHHSNAIHSPAWCDDTHYERLHFLVSRLVPRFFIHLESV